MADRSRSRSPVHSKSHEIEEDDDIPPPNPRRFFVYDLPTSWTFHEVKQFVQDRTASTAIHDSIEFVKMDKNSNSASIVFGNEVTCKEAYIRLKRTESEKYQGKIVKIQWERKAHPQGPPKREKFTVNPNRGKPMFKPKKPKVSMDTYGLSQNFLNSLKIKLPLLNKIFVANLVSQVDEAKIREIFSYAGHVVDVFMIHKDGSKIMAKIEFDHPLEAVQAISMFHNTELFGRNMAVQMDNSPQLYSKQLPVGLASVGPGLGADGEPLKGIRSSIEVQQLKEFIIQEIDKLKTLVQKLVLNTASSGQEVNSMSLLGNAPFNSLAPLNVNTMNPFIQSLAMNPLANIQGTQNLQMLQQLIQSGSGDLSTALAALQAQNSIGSNFAFGSNSGQEQKPQQSFSGNQYNSQSDKPQPFLDRSSDYGSTRSSVEGEKKMTSSDVLIISNLPESVTLSALKNKMREVGDVNFAELTDEGEAIVRFFSASDAERCLKLFDRSKVDGKTINVRYF